MELTITPAIRAKWEKINAKREANDQPPLNFPLFVKVRNRIDAIPESYNQALWVVNKRDSPCGTAACLAGEAIICAAPDVTEGIKRLWSLEHDDEVLESAAEALGILNTFDDSDETVIFDGDGGGFPEPWGERFAVANDSKEEAEVAVSYLDYVIRTGRVLG